MPRNAATSLLMLLAATVILSGCPGLGSKEAEGTVTEVPECVTYEEHIQPLMAAYCDQCHSSPPAGGAPGGFRTDIEGNDAVVGVSGHFDRIYARSADSAAPMPPAPAPRMTDIELKTLEEWAKTGKLRNAEQCATADLDAGTPDVDVPEPYVPITEPIAEPSQNDVFDILDNRCAGCHGPNNNADAEAVFTLGAVTAMRETLTSAGVLIPCFPDTSSVVTSIESGSMPPGAVTLTPAETQTVRNWVANGATPNFIENACENVLEHPVAEPGFTEVETLLRGCTGNNCHDADNPASGLNLTTLETTVLGGDNGAAVLQCDPEGSNLYTKLLDDPPFGRRMPRDETPLPDREIQTIRNWILGGAEENYNATLCAPGNDVPEFAGFTVVPEGTGCGLSWSEATTTITVPSRIRYRIWVAPEGTVDTDAEPTRNVRGETNFTVMDLTAGTTYDIVMTAVSILGDESAPITMQCVLP